MTVEAKICGIKSLESGLCAAEAGAKWLGFIHFEKSPRHLSFGEMATLMAQIRAQRDVLCVAVMVDPEDFDILTLNDAVMPDLIQLHGHETPERVAAIKDLSACGLIKAISVSDADDLLVAETYAAHVEGFLFDAKPPKDAVLPGGLGLSFDPNLLANKTFSKPWWLAGGLTPETVAKAASLSGALRVDVSSGVEKAAGEKDPNKIYAFLNALKTL